MRLISLNASQPRLIHWRGETFSTGIFKQPVTGPVRLRKLNFDGDRQADLSVHGGPLKAVYAYSAEHYPWWRRELDLAAVALPWGMFGENLTTEDMTEEVVHIGDQFRIGTATLMAVQPRVPCYKLAARFDRDDMIDRFMASGRSGIYFSVVEEGMVTAGNVLERIAALPQSVTVAEVNQLMSGDRMNADLLRRAAQIKELPEGYRQRFASRLAQLA